MKNQTLTLILLCFFFPFFLGAQWKMPYGSMKNNSLSVGFTSNKEIRFGYEYLLSPRSSINLGLGYGLRNLDPNLKAEKQQVLVKSFPREVETVTTWILFFPSVSSKASVPLPPTYETKTRGRYLQSSLDFYGEYKHFFGGDLRHKVQNGFYLAPGVSIGRQKFATYTFLSGRKNEIKVLNSRSSFEGALLLLGASVSNREELVSVVDYKEIEKKHGRSIYLRPHLSAGWQLPVADAVSFDFGARIFWSSERFDPELQPEESSATAAFRGVATGRCSFWF